MEKNNLVADYYQHLKELLPDVEILDATPILNRMRMIKTPQEIEELKLRTNLTLEALRDCYLDTKVGETELQIQARAITYLLEKGFDTIATAIELARQAIKPGIQGVEIDKIAREYIISQGYEEFPHGLGHQVGRFAHDGTALLGPAWEKYAQKPFQPLEEGMVFTIEPRLKVPSRGVVTIEEMVVITRDGAEFLAEPQKEIILI